MQFEYLMRQISEPLNMKLFPMLDYEYNISSLSYGALEQPFH